MSSVSSSASPSAPDEAVSTRCPRGVSTASRRRRLTDWSSTASTVTGSSINRPFRFEHTDASQRVDEVVAAQRLE